ncbi:MAG: hypothetical protein FJW86_10615 [Actinobacteria bacterium]|nr:hypothetical protein [Actinomycetota bacterium]
MLPFERLRALARSGGDDTSFVVDAADCLAEFQHDPTQLVTVCRRLLAHHVECGPLWWLCAHVVAAADPATGAREAVRRLEGDRTATRLGSLLPFPHDDPIAVLGWPEIAGDALLDRPDLDVVAVRPRASDPSMVARLRRNEHTIRVIDEHELSALAPTHLLLESSAAGPTHALLPPGAADLLWALPDSSACWLVLGVGRLLPARLYEVLRDEALRNDLDVVEMEVNEFQQVAGPAGLEAPDRLIHRVDCPVAPELLRL